MLEQFSSRSMRAILTIVLAAFALPVLASGKIGYGSRAGMQVTVVSMSGLNTAHAVIRTRHTREDAVAFCRYYVRKITEPCIRGELTTPLNDLITANCSTGYFTDFFGTSHQFMGRMQKTQEFEPDFKIVDLDTGTVEDGSGASYYLVNLEIFRALCPRTLAWSR